MTYINTITCTNQQIKVLTSLPNILHFPINIYSFFSNFNFKPFGLVIWFGLKSNQIKNQMVQKF